MVLYGNVSGPRLLEPLHDCQGRVLTVCVSL